MIKLTKRVVVGAPYYEINIKADGNDGDYVTTKEVITEKEFNESYSYYLYMLNKLVDVRHGLDKEQRDVYTDFVFYNLSIPMYCDERCHTLTDLDITYHYEDCVYDVSFESAPQLADDVMQELLSRIQYGNESLFTICGELGIEEDELTMRDLAIIDEKSCTNCHEEEGEY